MWYIDMSEMFLHDDLTNSNTFLFLFKQIKIKISSKENFVMFVHEFIITRR
jgi:hypothetical protein